MEDMKPRNGSGTIEVRCENSNDLISLLNGINLDDASENQAKKGACPDSQDSLKDLKELRLWGSKFHARDIAQAVTRGTDLKTLEMEKVTIEGDQDDFDLIAEALETCNVETFALTNFSITDKRISLDRLVEALGTVPNLNVAKLEVKRYTTVTLSDSIANLCAVPTLEDLQLSGLHLSALQVSLVANAIKKNDKLKIVRLNLVSLNDKGASILAEAIGDSNNLKRLDLSGNHIGDMGCTALAEALTKNSSLESVQLYGNKNIRSKGMAALAKMLEVNRNISKFDAPVSEDRENRVKIEVCLSNNREIARPA